MKLLKKISVFLFVLMSSLFIYLVNVFFHEPKAHSSPYTRYLLKFDYDFILKPAVQCENKSEFFFGAFVCSSIPNFKERQTIRETWGSRLRTANATTLVFVTGRSRDKSAQMMLIEEATKYSDIIQADFDDTYLNLTLKVLTFLKWVDTFCPNLEYAMKIDDDVFLNIDYLSKYLRSISFQNSHIVGYLVAKGKPHRNPISKWYVPMNIFSPEYFPQFIHGHGYVISKDAVKKLYHGSSVVPFFHLEDVYFTGFIGAKMKIDLINHEGFELVPRKPSGCSFRKAITGHQVKPNEMYQIWTELNDPNLNCSDNFT